MISTTYELTASKQVSSTTHHKHHIYQLIYLISLGNVTDKKNKQRYIIYPK